MTSSANKPTRKSGTSRFGGLVGILLCLTATCDTSVLAQVLDRTVFVSSGCAALSEVTEPPEDDDDMIRTGTSGELRRGERKHSTPGTAWAPGPILSPGRLCRSSSGSLLPTDRSGSEHARRNGLGAPLLC